MLTGDRIRSFRDKIYGYYRLHGRDLQWRHTEDPYGILVSEIMLQQTQVERVSDRYPAFLKAFPGFDALAKASLKDVLTAWQGMGYNRRALSLKQLAEKVVSVHGGRLPRDLDALSSLPGIGKTTAGAILAFAFNIPSVFIETNIRRVFIHEFFGEGERIRDNEILPFVEATLDRENPREWYWALMDYGSVLKKVVENPNRRSARYVRQSTFEGSDRRIRGMLLRIILGRGHATHRELVTEISVEDERVRAILTRMAAEGLVREEDGVYRID